MCCALTCVCVLAASFNAKLNFALHQVSGQPAHCIVVSVLTHARGFVCLLAARFLMDPIITVQHLQRLNRSQYMPTRLTACLLAAKMIALKDECGKPVFESAQACFYVFHLWHHVWLTCSECVDLAGMAITLVCDKCLRSEHPEKYASTLHAVCEHIV